MPRASDRGHRAPAGPGAGANRSDRILVDPEQEQRPPRGSAHRPARRLGEEIERDKSTYVIPPRCNRTHENGALAPSAYRQWTGHRWPRRNPGHQRHEHHEPVETGRWPILFLDDRRAMMAITSRHEVREAPVGSRYGTRKVVAIGVAIGCVLGAGTALAGGDGRFCSATANDQFKACGNEVKDDFSVAHAKCVNVSDPGEREACLAEARAQRREGRQLCGEQRVARKALCAALGEDRYDPDFDPANFDSDFRNLTNPNPYRPLGSAATGSSRAATRPS